MGGFNKINKICIGCIDTYRYDIEAEPGFGEDY
jgi:hypothetical protein